MKKGLLIVVILLAVASMMAAMAYNSASVTNAADMQVVNTTSSLLALNVKGGLGNADQAAWVDDQGKLNFDFSRGRGMHPDWLPVGTQYGFQRGSTYTWDEMFTVKNNSNDGVIFRIDADTLPHISVTAVKNGGAGINIPFVVDGANNNNAVGLAPGDTDTIKVSFTIPEDFSGDLEQIFNGTLTVKSKAVDSVWRHGITPWE